ncbi:MAG: RNA polymerase sigma factor [Cyclobacteriaceae bacterium]|nr:RNA polymerase sigma factor [Cyclobacteriaceae bacterium]
METPYRNIHQEVIDMCMIGDRQAQFQFYKLYSKAMYNISYRITNNEMDAEDVLQESFVSAFKNMQKYQGTASIGAWLKRIVINTAINTVKRRKMELLPIEEQAGVLELEEEDDSELFLNVEKIRDAIQKLPDGYRLVFSLYLLEGYDHAEIASILKISESTSKSQYNRSKKKLKQILREEFLYDG